jgi:hypothetical protein
MLLEDGLEGYRTERCALVENEKIRNPVQAWFSDFSALCRYTTILMGC